MHSLFVSAICLICLIAMLLLSPEMLVFLSLVLSVAIVYVSVPTIVNIANLKNLVDEPGKRKSHHTSIPNLGGIAIFAGFLISTGVFANLSINPEFGYLFIGLIVLFFVGLKDDILVIAPTKKLIGEIFAALIVAVIGNLHFTDLHGFLGIHQIGHVTGLIITIFVMVVIINSFNLIDGIDGLASGTGVIITLTFSVWFYLTGYTNYAILAASLAGALLCFFGYNVYGLKNKIFMGDTGSLLVGMVMSVLVIKFNEINAYYRGPYFIQSAPAVSFSILILPLFDTLRVFLLRLFRGLSPFTADKNHLHHRLLKFGFSHVRVTTILLIFNIIIIGISFTLQSIGIISLITINISLCLLFTLITEFLIRKSKIEIIRQSQLQHQARA